MYLLGVLAIPYFLENAWEVYYGTFFYGPQMIGFVIGHADPNSLFMRGIRYSGVAYGLFFLFSIISFIQVIFGSRASRHDKIFAWCFVVMATHAVLLTTYGNWAPFFLKER